MSEELKVTIYEPSKDPRTVSKTLDPEFIPLIDRGVYFNADGSLCDDFQKLPEDLAADEMIGFNLDSAPPAPNTANCTDAVHPIQQRQQKLQKKLDHLHKIKGKIHLKNKINKIRKKLNWAKRNEAVLLADPESCLSPNASSQPQNDKPATSKPVANSNPNRKPPRFKKKKKAQPKSANNTHSQLPNPSRFPAFIRNPWMRKQPPKNAPRTNNQSANNFDYIPIGNHSQPRFRSHLPPLTNTGRYFNLNNC